MCNASKTLSRLIAAVTVNAFRWKWLASKVGYRRAAESGSAVPAFEERRDAPSLELNRRLQQEYLVLRCLQLARVCCALTNRQPISPFTLRYLGSIRRLRKSQRETTRRFPTRRESNRQVFQTEEPSRSGCASLPRKIARLVFDLKK